jgi:hypothetical protein
MIVFDWEREESCFRGGIDECRRRRGEGGGGG